MDTLGLKILPASASPSQAWLALRESGKSGLIIDYGAKNYGLVWVGALVEAMRHKVPTLGSIPHSEPVRDVKPQDAGAHKLNLTEPHKTAKKIEQYLDEGGVQYALNSAAPGAPQVFTRHEELAALLNGDTLQCDGVTPPHTFPQPIKRVGDNCPSCAAVNGVRPKLHLLK